MKPALDFHIDMDKLRASLTRFETPAYNYDDLYSQTTRRSLIGNWLVLEENNTHYSRDGYVCRYARLKVGRWCFTAHWHGGDVCAFVVHRGIMIRWELPSGLCIGPYEEGF